MPRTSLKLVTSNISWRKDTLSKKKLVFLKIQLHLQRLNKVPSSTIFLLQHCYFNSPIGKHMAQVYQNTWPFDQYLLNSRSNMHVNFVYWISLHPKNGILPTFLGQTPHFISEKQKPRTSNLHHQKAGSVAVILSLRVGVQHIQKSGAIIFPTQWQSNVHCILQGLL